DLRALAHEYYLWRDAAYPVATSQLGRHDLDNKLADYSMPAVNARRKHVTQLIAKVNALSVSGWSKDDKVDQLLFLSQLRGADFFGRKLDAESHDPQLYVN